MIITGKGAGKSEFEKEVKELEKKWEWVRVRTAWLAFEDYPKLLGTSPLSLSCLSVTRLMNVWVGRIGEFGNLVAY